MEYMINLESDQVIEKDKLRKLNHQSKRKKKIIRKK